MYRTIANRKDEVSWFNAGLIYSLVLRPELYTAKGQKTRKRFLQFVVIFFLALASAALVGMLSNEIGSVNAGK